MKWIESKVNGTSVFIRRDDIIYFFQNATGEVGYLLRGVTEDMVLHEPFESFKAKILEEPCLSEEQGVIALHHRAEAVRKKIALEEP